MGRPGVIPAWKVRRELGRLGQQLRAIPEAVWEPFAAARMTGRWRAGFRRWTAPGACAQGALVLCWQPRGLAPSFLDMLDHLVTCGYAPFVVSNAPLSSADRQSLHPRIWRAVERPNFGYDFGGYRDGLFLLRRWGIRPDRLVILNDSIWFPLCPMTRPCNGPKPRPSTSPAPSCASAMPLRSSNPTSSRSAVPCWTTPVSAPSGRGCG